MRNHPAGMRTSAGRYSSSLDRESSSASMGSKRPQCADDIFDSILLKQADGGDPGCSGGKARRCVLQVDAAQSEHRDLRPAGFAQGGEARGLGSRRLSLSEYRSENGKVGGLRFGAEDIGGGGAGGGGGGGAGDRGGGGGGGLRRGG